MPDFAYTTVPGKIPTLFLKIRDVGIPSKVSANWLKIVGFTSSNDSSLLTVLKQIGFIDGSSAPTSAWNEYRSAKHAEVLARQIKQGYASLFEVYADANSRTQAEVENVFMSKSTAGKQAISKTYTTFKALCGLADFKEVHEAIGSKPNLEMEEQPDEQKHRSSQQSRKPAAPSMHIDIQVHIAPETSAEQIDLIFKSMAKYFYGASDK